MPYEIEPVPTTEPSADFPVPTVRVLNFTGTGFTCSRGTGEQSNVITILITPPAPPAQP